MDALLSEMDQMDALLSMITLALLVAPLHAYLTKRDFLDLQGWLINFMIQRQGVQDFKEAWMEEELVKLRQANYKLLSRIFSQAAFCAVLSFTYSALSSPGLETIGSASVVVASYVQHLLVAKEVVCLTPGRIKFLTYLHHIMAFLLHILQVASESDTFGAKAAPNTATRFVLVFAFLDPWVSIPFQFLFTAADALTYFTVCSGSHMAPYVCFGLCFVFVSSVASSVFMHVALRGRIRAVLDTADAESLVSSFRKVLRGVCDGEVLLDSRMNVLKESECLKHLILTNVSLAGLSFQDLLADDERSRFDAFIRASTQTFGERTDSATPLCLRVSLRGSEGIRVAADLYHVPVPGLFGDDEPSHLIAFKEDLDSRSQVPAAHDGAVPAALLTGRGAAGTRDPKPSDSISNSSRSSTVGDKPELQEMFLLVDPQTQLHDVTQVELNFLRYEEPQDVPTALHSSMPSLRKLVKPTDWERVRSRVVRFAEKAWRDPSRPHSMQMNPMTIQLPGLTGWFSVDEAGLHHHHGEKLWLHLRGFRPQKPRRSSKMPSLSEIQEGDQLSGL
ncbi:unnamed protein product [Durusdinium trenchii]|uniref:Uncharacterized protein n=1 Tax=Durusdinium trenchii TaxID=1381693 RepID=A0ABP0RSY9_9DINO